MNEGVMSMIYLVAGVLFILSLGGLAHQETARRGNLLGVIGITIAIAVTFFQQQAGSYPMMVGMLTVGGVIGWVLAARVQMTGMPQLVAILHSFVGLAAVLVGVSTYLDAGHVLEGVERSIHYIEIFVGVFIGAVTFTGSVVAFGKLQGIVGSKPLMVPGRHLINLAIVGGSIYLGAQFLSATGHEGLIPLLVMAVIAGVLGVHLVMAIGGADMPVVVSMLNSYSGWAAAATGFMLKNDLLIITGALVGSSGAILSYIMCKAMNRSIVSVIFGGFGTVSASTSGGSQTVAGEIEEISAQDTCDLLLAAKNVVVVPGYGMAVAQAQHMVSGLAKKLIERGTQVRFAIHPVAGRLPGHMNVLLAEAHVSYDIVLEMDEINPEIDQVDVVLVIGANDIVNPGALDDESSPIYGMPVIEAWRAGKSIIMKRGLAAGYAGVDNPLFYKDNSLMLFGDARASTEAILSHLDD